MRSTKHCEMLKPGHRSGSHGGLVSVQVPSPEFQIQVWGLGICISNNFPADAILFQHTRTTELVQPLQSYNQETEAQGFT